MAEKETGGKNKVGFENDAIDYAILAFIIIAVVSTSLGISDIKDVPRFLEEGYKTYPKSFVDAFIPWATLHGVLFKTISILTIVLSITGITYFLLRLRRVRMQEYEKHITIDIESEKLKNLHIHY